MRAVVYHGQGDVRVECLPLPACEEGGLLVKVEACAVCGSDMKAYRSGNPRMRPPVTMGHEFVGAVVENRAGLAFAVGDSVVMATSVACGTCTYCARGWRNLCAAVRPMGFSFPGGMADYVAIPALAVRGGHVVKVPVSLNPFHAALAEPVSCAVNACENGAVRQGDTVLVMGAGPMGILNAVVARRFGAARVILSEINPARLKQAEAFGVDRLVDPSRESLPDVVRDATQGLGADVVIVAAPAAGPMEQALALVRKRGTVCLFASLPVERSTLALDSRLIHYNELRVTGSSDSTPAQVAKAVALLASAGFPSAHLVTHVLPFEGFMDAIGLMARGEAPRVVLTP